MINGLGRDWTFAAFERGVWDGSLPHSIYICSLLEDSGSVYRISLPSLMGQS